MFDWVEGRTIEISVMGLLPDALQSVTPLEHCEWLNKLLMEVWPNFLNPKLSKRFSLIVERMMHMGFERDANDVSILLLAMLAKPLIGTTQIVINSLHIKGDLIFMSILDGQAILYSFESIPEVRIGVAFGSGNNQSLLATKLQDLKKDAVGSIFSVTVSSASGLIKGGMRGSYSGRQNSSMRNANLEGDVGDRVAQMFVEVELGELTRRTSVSAGSVPRRDITFNMVLHENIGVVRFNLYEWVSKNVMHYYITRCEIKLKYVTDDSTTFWAIGPGSSVLAKRVEYVGQEVEMVPPLEGINSGEVYSMPHLNNVLFISFLENQCTWMLHCLLINERSY
ncbi:hypothetical protein GIB67_015377 [Kingdonia uniflora]|uniref:Uncharacterized protein n=1 Tax=Kingdonia uniflora TaxID=39325 RepID=A0A7J7KZ10_9MAGN|nr:hypothetical protein GIB67_015377 [Kingdonia uniflora]